MKSFLNQTGYDCNQYDKHSKYRGGHPKSNEGNFCISQRRPFFAFAKFFRYLFCSLFLFFGFKDSLYSIILNCWDEAVLVTEIRRLVA